MRVGGWIWFLAGIISWELLQNGALLAVLQSLIGAVRQIAVYLGAVGTISIVAITAVVFAMVARTVTENARARFDMEQTWDRRKNYRLPKNQRK